MRLSTIDIIIPTFNEAASIGALLQYLQDVAPEANIWIANSPNTTDDTARIAQCLGVQVIACPFAGRAAQMNYATQHTTGDILYFVHADVFPPQNFLSTICETLNNGKELGYFSYQFDGNNPLLKLNSWCTTYNTILSGGGDQTLFIRRSTFEQLNGFSEHLQLMEDFDLIWRAKRAGHKPILICDPVTVSARKYVHNSWLKVNTINLATFFLFRMGIHQSWLVQLQSRLK